MSAPVVQLRVPEDTLARLDGARGDDTRTAWILRLIDRELAGQTGTPPPANAARGTLPPASRRPA